MLSPAQIAILNTVVLDYPMRLHHREADRILLWLIDLGLATQAKNDRDAVIPTRDGILTYYRLSKQPMPTWPC